jgi:hypothetical protein
LEDLSLHILDIVENATRAGADFVEIIVTENREADLFKIIIRDNGRGMDSDMLERVRDPFATTRTERRVGLGIPMLDQAAREAEGELVIHSKKNSGTEIIATFKSSHIDRKPLGDIGSTLVTLIMGNPDIDFLFQHESNGDETIIDTREIRTELGEISITEPSVLNMIRELFQGIS